MPHLSLVSWSIRCISVPSALRSTVSVFVSTGTAFSRKCFLRTMLANPGGMSCDPKPLTVCKEQEPPQRSKARLGRQQNGVIADDASRTWGPFWAQGQSSPATSEVLVRRYRPLLCILLGCEQTDNIKALKQRLSEGPLAAPGYRVHLLPSNLRSHEHARTHIHAHTHTNTHTHAHTRALWLRWTETEGSPHVHRSCGKNKIKGFLWVF